MDSVSDEDIEDDDSFPPLYGKSLNRTDLRGRTPIFDAVSYKKTNCLEWLIDAKADLSVRDSEQNNLLTLAAIAKTKLSDNIENSCIGVLNTFSKLLPEKQLEEMCKEKNVDGQTPMINLCANLKFQHITVASEVLCKLVELKSDVSARDNLGWNCLHWSVNFACYEFVDMIASIWFFLKFEMCVLKLYLKCECRNCSWNVSVETVLEI